MNLQYIQSDRFPHGSVWLQKAPTSSQQIHVLTFKENCKNAFVSVYIVCLSMCMCVAFLLKKVQATARKVITKQCVPSISHVHRHIVNQGIDCCT